MLTVKIQTRFPNGSMETMIRECERVYYTEKYYSQINDGDWTMRFGDFINPNGSSAIAAWCVLVHVVNGDEESIILCLPESLIYILQNGKTIDTVKAHFIPIKSDEPYGDPGQSHN